MESTMIKYDAVALGLSLLSQQASALSTSELCREVRSTIFENYISYLQNEKDKSEIEPGDVKSFKQSAGISKYPLNEAKNTAKSKRQYAKTGSIR